MDWKYILSLSPDNLGDDEKEHLYATIVCFECDSERFDHKKYNALLKISQELLKHKSEQVEALLAELDEIAVRQGEEEARKQESLEDLTSVKSKRSVLDYEDLEQRYKDSKIKIKQQLKVIETLKEDNGKLKQNLVEAEEENLHLQSEIKTIVNKEDESRSDISESTSEQYKELFQTIQQKNKQIAQLLGDIQAVEQECLTLQDKLSKVTDELSDASNQLSIMINDYTALKIQLKEKNETIMQLEDDIEVYRSQVQDYIEEKQQRDNQIDEFTITIDKRVDEWKRILEEKDNELKKLRAESKEMSSHSSRSSLSSEEDKSYVAMLTKVIQEREEQLSDLRMQLQEATFEMEESTALLKQLTIDKNMGLKRTDELTSVVKNLKNQLKATHNRCKDLQENIDYAENVAESRQEDINKILTKLKDDGRVELSEELERLQKLKSQLRVKDKQIVEYVRMTNELQNTIEHIVNENSALRNKLGIAEDEDISVAAILLKQYKQSKQSNKMQKQINVLEEEKLSLKSEIQQMQRKISSLSLQTINTHGSKEKETNQIQYLIQADYKQHTEQYVKLLEENEGLRKGLHEILISIQGKNEHSRNKRNSTILEKILCVLESHQETTIHYPAVQLQTEIHTLEGINKELKEQLIITRNELASRSESKSDLFELEIPSNVSSSAKEILDNTNKHLLNVLNSYHEQEEVSSKLVQKLEEYKESFDIIEEQLKLVYKEYAEEKRMWEKNETQFVNTISKLEENVDVLTSKLKEFDNINEEEYKKIDRFAEISGNMIKLNRKCVFLENEESRLTNEVKKLKTNLSTAEENVAIKMLKLNNEKNEMTIKMETLKKSLDFSVSRLTLINVQNQLDSITVKYRNVLQDMNNIKSKYDKDVHLLHEIVKSLEDQKVELHQELYKATVQLRIHEALTLTNGVEVVSKKLAQTEVSEISERQRANHMTNLYGLVKDQLQKSERKYQEQEKQSQHVLDKNLLLQKNMKDLEDQLINSVSLETFTDLKNKYIHVEEENYTLLCIINKLKIDLMESKKSRTDITEQSHDNLEILSLKHQILDLQSMGDDKALIARLSSDVVLARLSETQSLKIVEDLQNELLELQHNYDLSKSLLDKENLENDKLISMHENEISKLKQILYYQRELYLGSCPLNSEEALIANIRLVLKDKQDSFLYLQHTRKKEYELFILKEELNKGLDTIDDLKKKTTQDQNDTCFDLRNWFQERNTILIKELRYQKELEFKTMQIEQLSERLKTQDEVIIKLEEELLRTIRIYEVTEDKKEKLPRSPLLCENEESIVKREELKMLKQKEVQTCSELIAPLSVDKNLSALLVNLETKLSNYESDLEEKCGIIEQLRNKITELEMNISLFRTQIGDKQSQITFYEKHILDLQNKLKIQAESQANSHDNDAEQSKSCEEIAVLKESLKGLQETNMEKETELLKYQRLLKRDRDEHSLAAARTQRELKRLQEIISAQEKAYKELQETSIQYLGKAAIEQYINQVHALEKHTVDLHTTVSTLNSQLQSSRQESIRWQTLANERLGNMEHLRAELEEHHQNELDAYKNDSDKWREEFHRLKELMSKRKHDIQSVEPDLRNILKEKDDEIRDLTNTIKRMRLETKRSFEKSDSSVSPKVSDLEATNDQLVKDNELLKKKYEQIFLRERQAKEEVYSLKEQLLKKPLSGRSDKSEKEEKYQKRIKNLETENEDLKDKLQKQMILSEAHRVTVAEDFEKWKKQKYWQQSAEKLKVKLQEKIEEYDKLNQTCSGYKILIERLEREKHVLENKIKVLRTTESGTISKRIDALHAENDRLTDENETLNEKLHIRKHHSGSLGAAMLEEKLQTQEKKIAVLELTNKCNPEVRVELEHMQSALENLQKLNLRLEAENLDLKLDLEKYGNDLPHLRDQIQHLESYIEVLKSENEGKHVVSESGDTNLNKCNDLKKISQLERTVFVLKRVVEKLQVENKRLHAAKPCQTSDRYGYDKLRMEYSKLKEQYGNRIQEVKRLEEQLKYANNKISTLEQRELSKEVSSLASELSTIKMELNHKTELLDKIKVLLHRAAAKEKSLLEQGDFKVRGQTLKGYSISDFKPKSSDKHISAKGLLRYLRKTDFLKKV
ncbi:hypothetical protein FQA39_LY02320 [Lamprigera yunnana]|nr:hypothetical protein FQA39_LY02320 [Lamprigera yunnana]